MTVRFRIQHNITGHYLAGQPSAPAFDMRRVPDAEGAFSYPDFTVAESERRLLREFAGAWMSVPYTVDP